MKIVKESKFDIGSHVNVEDISGELIGRTVSDVYYDEDAQLFMYKIANHHPFYYPEHMIQKYK